MQQIESGNFAVSRWLFFPPNSIRVVNWNIDRGLKLSGVIEFLAGAKADIILLQEADLNARRTHQINVAKEIAQKLEMNYVFAREFQELTQGSRMSPAYHGQATDCSFSGAAWRAHGAGQRREHCRQNDSQLQPALGEQRRG